MLPYCTLCVGRNANLKATHATRNTVNASHVRRLTYVALKDQAKDQATPRLTHNCGLLAAGRLANAAQNTVEFF